MERVIIAFADKDAAVFKPVYAEFPIVEESVKAYYLKDDKSIIEAARVMLGLDAANKYIIGTLWNTPEHPHTPDQFFVGLRERWEIARCKHHKQNPVQNQHMVIASNLHTGELFERLIDEVSFKVDSFNVVKAVDDAKKTLGMDAVCRVYYLTKTFTKSDAIGKFAEEYTKLL